MSEEKTAMKSTAQSTVDHVVNARTKRGEGLAKWRAEQKKLKLAQVSKETQEVKTPIAEAKKVDEVKKVNLVNLFVPVECRINNVIYVGDVKVPEDIAVHLRYMVGKYNRANANTSIGHRHVRDRGDRNSRGFMRRPNTIGGY